MSEENLEYITSNWYYRGVAYPKQYVGVVTEDSDECLRIGLNGRPLWILDKRNHKDITREPFNNQIDPHPVWGFRVTN